MLSRLREFWLEALLFAIAIGQAEVLREYLLATGSRDTVQLTVAIYSTELLICFAGLWGVSGLVMATVMFCVGLISVYHLYGAETPGHAYFGLGVWLGTIANYSRRRLLARVHTRNAGVAADHRGVVDGRALQNWPVARLRQEFDLSHRKAKEMKELLASGRPVSTAWIEANRKEGG
jgi:hypothetical protein